MPHSGGRCLIELYKQYFSVALRVSRRHLNACNDGASTTAAGKRFHLSTTRTEKKFCLRFREHLSLESLNLWPLVVLVESRLRRLMFTEYRLCVYLNTSIRSPLSLLYCMVGIRIFFSLSVYSRSLNRGITLVARLRTLSTRSLSFCSRGAHATLPNSYWGRTSAMNNCLMLSLSR